MLLNVLLLFILNLFLCVVNIIIGFLFTFVFYKIYFDFYITYGIILFIFFYLIKRKMYKSLMFFMNFVFTTMVASYVFYEIISMH